MEAIIFIGIPASGKSTFYLQRFFETHIRINLDMLKTRRRERILIEACLAAQQRFVVDNTNVTRDARAPYITAARAARFRVVGYYFHSSLSSSLERNKGRDPQRVIPVRGVAAKYHKLQIPAIDEGFDELYSVVINPAGGFTVQPWAGPTSADAR